MASVINASVSSNGIVSTADASGILKVQSNGKTTNALAWVNFDGTTSPGTIRSAYNVGSVTKNGTGDYTLNFTNSLTDSNYSAVGSSQRFTQLGYNTQSTTQLEVLTQNLAGNQSDVSVITVAVFGN
jgi:hypothetical protein